MSIMLERAHHLDVCTRQGGASSCPLVQGGCSLCWSSPDSDKHHNLYRQCRPMCDCTLAKPFRSAKTVQYGPLGRFSSITDNIARYRLSSWEQPRLPTCSSAVRSAFLPFTVFTTDMVVMYDACSRVFAVKHTWANNERMAPPRGFAAKPICFSYVTPPPRPGTQRAPSPPPEQSSSCTLLSLSRCWLCVLTLVYPTSSALRSVVHGYSHLPLGTEAWENRTKLTAR